MSRFGQILEQACAAEREVRALQADKAAWRLSAEAFVRAALEQAGCEEARLDALEVELHRPGLDALQRAFARMCRHVAEINAPHLRLRHLLTEEADSQLGTVRGTRPELFAAAVRHMAATQPEIFGTATVPGEAQERLEVLKQSRDHLFREVARSWSAEDVVVEDVPGQHPRVTLRATGTTIGNDLAQQAVNVMLGREELEQAA